MPPPPAAETVVVAPPPVAAETVLAPPPTLADAVVAPPPIAAETVVAPPPTPAEVVNPPPPTPDEALVAPPPIAAQTAVVAPPPTPAEAVVTPPPTLADAVVAPPPIAAETVVAPPPTPAEALVAPPPEQMVKDAEENGALALPSSDSESDHTKQPEETVQHLGHLLPEQRSIMAYDTYTKRKLFRHRRSWLHMKEQSNDDIDDLSDDSPTRSSDDQSDLYNDGDYYWDNPKNRWDDPYRFIHGRYRRKCQYSCTCNARRNHLGGGYPLIPGFGDLCNPMASVDTEHWDTWPSFEPDCGRKRCHMVSSDIGHVNRWSPPEPYYVKKKYNVGAGLSNPNWWTCFINCILQCLVHTVPLVLKLRKADHPDPCPRASTGFCCHCSLKLHVDESIRLSGSAFYPESFVNHLQSISATFERGVQQDAEEFLHCLLDKLDEASISLRSSAEEPPSSEEGGIAKEIFGGRFKSQLHCPECNRCSDKSEPFLDLSVGVSMMETLMDALESFTKVELIEDVMCDGCKSRVSMEKHIKVEQAPEVLVIHLKRFTNEGLKISDKVKYPLELDIKPFMSSSDNTPKYNLYGVVEHHGQYVRGHYVCYIRSSEADWYEINDDKVSRYSEAGVLDITAYLLFYVKQGSSPWFSSLLEKEELVPTNGPVSLAVEGVNEIAPVDNKEEESTSSLGLENSDHSLTGATGENGNGPSMLDVSQGLQWNGNLLDGASEAAQELISFLSGSSNKNGHADGQRDPSENKEAVSPRRSLEEMKQSRCGCSEDDSAATNGGSLRKNENNCSAATNGGSLRENENNCSLLQSSHEQEDKCHHRNFSLQDEETGCSSGAPSMGMGMCASENKTRVESKSNHDLRNDNKCTSNGKGEEQ